MRGPVPKYHVCYAYISGSALSDDDNYDHECRGTNTPKKHDPPLLYDLNLDPGERHPVSPTSEVYR